MATDEMRTWAAMPEAERQQAIADFLKDHDHAAVQRFLSMVRAPGGFGVYASCGPNYQYAVFGRDSIAVADELIEIQPDLSREIILLLARLQGTRHNSANEEEPGKIHHEYRTTHFNGEDISIAANKVLYMLYPVWGGTKDELCYYGSVDATPKFISLVAKYCDKHGDDILDEEVTGRDHHRQTVREHVRMAIDWLVNRVLASQWHLLESHRLTPSGLEYQCWKDSVTAYLHADGTMSNADGGVASVEVQGNAYDALLAARFVAKSDDEAHTWRELANDIRRQTLDRMWMPKAQFFALGLDRDGQGNTRQIDTLTSNAAALLDSGLLHKADEHYIKPLVKMITSEQFMTDVGIRTRAVRHANLLEFADYHGSLVSWPHETFSVARGLRRHGYDHEAQKLEKAMLHAVSQAGEFYEFFLVQTDGAVKYHYRHENPDEPTLHAFGAANLPEPGQAWTISAVLAIANRH